VKRQIFGIGFSLFILFEGLRNFGKHSDISPFWKMFILSEYFPPFFPFMALTMAFALMVIPICMLVGEKFGEKTIVIWIAMTGQMTLTHYVMHITLGIITLGLISGIKYTGFAQIKTSLPPSSILLFAIFWFILSVIFSIFWSKKFKNGPLEMVMKKLSK
jgi:uncharacterized membrane protein YeiB